MGCPSSTKSLSDESTLGNSSWAGAVSLATIRSGNAWSATIDGEGGKQASGSGRTECCGDQEALFVSVVLILTNTGSQARESE
jgi:hypothetical protein